MSTRMQTAERMYTCNLGAKKRTTTWNITFRDRKKENKQAKLLQMDCCKYAIQSVFPRMTKIQSWYCQRIEQWYCLLSDQFPDVKNIPPANFECKRHDALKHRMCVHYHNRMNNSSNSAMMDSPCL